MMFDDPDQVTFLTDKTVLNELNQKILEDPDYPLPEGYFKVVDRQMNLRYELPDYLPIAESKKVSLTLLDEVINELFDFHFLVPIATFDNILKVKPSFNILSRPLPKQKEQ